MSVPIDAIKILREKTGAPLGSIRSALESAKGDEAKAIELLKQKGFEAALKRQDRATSKGRVEAYVHHDGRVGALAEVACETDFVSRTPEFQQFCRDVAMQVASQQPLCLSKDQLSSTHLDDAKQAGKTAEQFAKEACLLEQSFIKDASQTVSQYLMSLIGRTGEHIVIRRFVRFTLGEEPTT